MNINEKNLTVWNKATGASQPNKADNLFVRSISCQPRFLGGNRWEVPSTTKANTFYNLEVYFAGYASGTSHGLELFVECGCPAGRAKQSCKHAVSIHQAYEANYGYLFDLFGLNRNERFRALYDKAAETYHRIAKSAMVRAA